MARGELSLQEPAATVGAAVDAVDPGAARAAGENFPVALKMLPTSRRKYLMAVYRFARTTDDIGDEAPPDQRLALLDELEADLRRLYARLGLDEDGTAATPGPGRVRAGELGRGDMDVAGRGNGEGGGRNDGDEPSQGGGDGAEPRSLVVRGLGHAVAECAIPMQPFLDLIEANRQDQVVSRYSTFDDLLGYCRLSANPVGRIVLYVFGCFTRARAELSDSVCTALQLAEHWQDVAEDLRAGRIYLPGEDLDAYGCTEHDLAQASASPRVREMMTFETRRASELLDAGAPLIGALRGAARLAVAGYVAGGRAALAAIEAAGHDVLRETPRPGKRRLAGDLVLAYVRGR
ncbi:MAG TPA: squalene/phytoene synthase family protein [Streptosporangiaceae bacterium]|nr:squalene/phytoene synthase family protein [Streptosporangiaceae bacterium]